MDVLHVRNGTMQAERPPPVEEIALPSEQYWQLRALYTEKVLLLERSQVLEAQMQMKQGEIEQNFKALLPLLPEGATLDEYTLDLDARLLRHILVVSEEGTS